MQTRPKTDVQIWKINAPNVKNSRKNNHSYRNILFHEPGMLPRISTYMNVVEPWIRLFKTKVGTNIKKTISGITTVDSAKSLTGIIYIKNKSSDIIIRLLRIIGYASTQGMPEWSMIIKLSSNADNFKAYQRLMLLIPNLLL